MAPQKRQTCRVAKKVSDLTLRGELKATSNERDIKKLKQLGENSSKNIRQSKNKRR